MTSRTIAGHSFDVPGRYEEGHVMNAHEAKEANRHLAARLQVTLAKRIKTKMINGKLPKSDHEALQKELYDRVQNYEAGTRYRDPSQAQARQAAKRARKLAKAYLTTIMGVKRDEAAKYTSEMLDQLVADHPMLKQLAEQ